MNKFFLSTIIFMVSLSVSARQNIQEGEQSGIPDRADVQKQMKKAGTKEGKDKKQEVRENQEDTDPVFYDSTTSPKEMEEKNSTDI